MLEVILKLIALGFREYFDDSWNIFDFVMAHLGLVVTLLIQ